MKQNKSPDKIITFPVPLALNEIDVNNISTFQFYQVGLEEIIVKAIKYHIEGNILEAVKYYIYCINKGVKDERVFSNYGILLRDSGKLDQAKFFFKKAIEVKPLFAEAHSNLGCVLRDLDQLKEAEVSHRRSIKINPNSAESHLNLGCVLRDLGQIKEAEKYFRKAIQLNPNFNDAYFELSLIELIRGNYESGLVNYEYRDKNKSSSLYSYQIQRQINGRYLQKGELLLVVSDQGLGDTIHLMRYIPYLRRLGYRVIFCAQSKLHGLIKSSGIDQNPIVPDQVKKMTLEGTLIALFSIPRFLGVNPKNPIISSPYINTNKELMNKWKITLSSEKRPIIGINWQGNPNLEKSYKGRSIPLEIFKVLVEQNDITLLSLQKGFGTEQLENCSFKNKFVSCQSRINSTWDFLENAAIIENCDLIITCDTSIAHLAGGMGKKVWLLLKKVPFWTWGLEKEKTIWYPSMKLFRQKEKHNWQELMQRVSDTLVKEFVHKY